MDTERVRVWAIRPAWVLVVTALPPVSGLVPRQPQRHMAERVVRARAVRRGGNAGLFVVLIGSV